MAIIKIFFLGTLILTMTACISGKPFQPNHPTYTMWFKANVSEDGVKEVMRQCGYKNLYGYGGDRVTSEDTAKRENCMFRNGFQRTDGYKGICSLSGVAEKISACQH